MSPIEVIAIVALSAWAVSRQTTRAEVRRKGRFKMALVYGVVALAIGGFVAPQGTAGWSLLAISITLSVVVGLARGVGTRVWVEQDGSVVRQGSALTVGLFVAMIAAKFTLGAVADLESVPDGAGFAEVLAMIAVMVAIQAEIVWRRAQRLAPHLADHRRPSTDRALSAR